MILETVLIFIILGICSGLFSYFLDFCFNVGNIFDWYYLFIITYIEPKYPKIAKMLGVCNICFNFWVSTFIFVVYNFYLFNNINNIYFLPFISFSCFTSLLVNKLFN